jgi:hypothetical protein
LNWLWLSRIADFSKLRLKSFRLTMLFGTILGNPNWLTNRLGVIKRGLQWRCGRLPRSLVRPLFAAR